MSNTLKLDKEEAKDYIRDTIQLYFDTNECRRTGIITDCFSSLFEIVKEVCNETEFKKKTRIIIGVKNPLCDFNQDIRNVFSEKKPILFFEYKKNTFQEVSNDKLSNNNDIILIQDANILSQNLLYQLLKHFSAGALNIIQLRKNIEKAKVDASHDASFFELIY